MIGKNTPTIETDRLILRKFTEADAEDFFLLLRDEEVNTFLPWYPAKTLEEARAHLAANYLAQYEKPTAHRYAVCLKTDNRAIGYVGASDAEHRDFGYGLRKEFWHRGIMTEAAKAVADALKAAGYPYITATHDVNNLRSGRVMRKIGMTYRYSYVEQWQPKDIAVTFRMYQLNFDGNDARVYMGYWNQYPQHFVEQGV